MQQKKYTIFLVNTLSTTPEARNICHKCAYNAQQDKQANALDHVYESGAPLRAKFAKILQYIPFLRKKVNIDGATGQN